MSTTTLPVPWPSTDEARAEYLVDFVQGYCEALLWANTRVVDDEDLDVDRFWWLAPSRQWALEAFDGDDRQRITEQCEDFVTAQWADLRHLTPAQAGHDFLLTRSGHGAGFWDRGYGELGTRLSDASRVYGDTSAWCYDPEDPSGDPLAHLEQW